MGYNAPGFLSLSFAPKLGAIERGDMAPADNLEWGGVLPSVSLSLRLCEADQSCCT